jgi:hypothetical protein
LNRFPRHPNRRAAEAGAVALLFALVLVPGARADYAVLQSGQRLHITGYERAGTNLRLTMAGGTLEIPAETVVSIEPEDTFPPVRNKLPDVPFADLILSAAMTHGVAPELVASVIAIESNFNSRAVSERSAQGLMQLMPGTAARLGVSDAFDPRQNIDAGTRYLKELLDRYHGDLALALAGYNAGPDRVEQFRAIPPYPETRNYVRRVTEKFRRVFNDSGHNTARQ